MSDWISVEDRLPERRVLPNGKKIPYSVDVLVYDPPEKAVHHGWYDYKQECWFIWYGADEHKVSVAHWHPLPDPPEGQ